MRIACYRIDQKQIRPAQPALLVRTCRALQIVQLRQAHKRRQRLPVARRAAVDDAELQRAKRRAAKSLRRIQRRERYFGVLQRHAAVVQAERRRKGLVFGGHFNLLAAPERRRRLRSDGERQLRILRQLILVCQLNIAARARRRILHALADQLHARPRRAHGNLHRHRATVRQRHLRFSGVALLQLRRGFRVFGHHRQLVAAHRRVDLAGRKRNAVQRQRRNILQRAAL